MKAVTNAVGSCLITLCRAAFLYCAQVLWEKRCLYNKSCSYGNQDGCVSVEDPRVCLVQTAAESTLSARVTTCQFTKRKHEAKCKHNL